MTRSEFLKANIANARRILAQPNEQYPNGRMSHDVSRENLARWSDELGDWQVERGMLYADGRFAGYNESAAED